MPSGSLWTISKKPINIGINFAIAFVFFDIQFYLLKVLPGNLNESCYPGAYFNTPNLIFAAVISLISATNIIGLSYLMKQKWESKVIATGSLSIVGTLLAMLSSFCVFCIVPVVSLFGVGLSLAFFSENIELLKVLSLIALAVSAYLLNRLLSGCAKCVE